MTREVRVRIAPSPTGPLHIGTARTALFNYLFAKKHKGKFILRIEDTDLERSDPKYEKDIIKGLKWLGIRYDEGPDIKGKYGPYRQSERLKTYQKYIKQLLDKEKAYYCYCTKEELEKKRKEMLTKKLPPKYSGRCRNLTDKQKEELEKKGMKPQLVRFKTPKKLLKFKDLIRGNLEFDTDLIGDFSLAKVYPDGKYIPLYNFAVVIDDYLMKISHVIRGEDHISNTPKQILIQEALNFPRPKYAHLPLILNPDRTKLSKRHAPVAISEYKKQGYLPQALNNFIVLLGWNPKTTEEIFSLSELEEKFNLKGVQKGGAVFNIQRLDWINGYYIRKMDLNKLTKHCLPYLIKTGLIIPIPGETNPLIPGLTSQAFPGAFVAGEYYKIKETGEKVSFDYLKKIVALEQERMKKISEIAELTKFFFVRHLDYSPDLLRWKKMTNKEIKKSLEISKKTLENLPDKKFNKKNLEKILMIQAKKIGTGELLWPLRVALTGLKGSPGPFDILEILGKKKSLERIENALRKLI